MFTTLKKLALAVALTFSVATGMTVASGIAAPVPAEAGILSSVKKATVGAAKAVGRTAVGAAKGVVKGTRVVTRTVEKRVIQPVGKGVIKVTSTIGKTVQKLPGPLKCIVKCPL